MLLNRIQGYLSQHEPTVIVNQLDNNGLYEIKIPKKEGGTPDITALVRSAIPEAEPFSGLGFENECFRQSFLIYEIKERVPLTNDHVWGVTLLLKQEAKETQLKGQKVKDYHFEDLERIVFQILNILDDGARKSWIKERIPSSIAQADALQYAVANFKEFSANKTWGQIYKELH
jgi:hypothetical protein